MFALGLACLFPKGARHKVLTAKEGPRGYYKGKRCTATGFHTKHADYFIDRNRIREFVVPRSTNPALKPYVEAMSVVGDLKDEDFPIGKLSASMFKQLAEQAGNSYDPERAEPYDWLVNPPKEALEAMEQNGSVPAPHKRNVPFRPYGKQKKVANRPFMKYKWHN